MSKLLSSVLLLSLFLFSACSTHEEKLPSNVKSFEDEDRLAIFALYASQQGDANSTISIFEVLYEKSGKKEYRDEELITLIQSHQNERALKKIAIYRSELDDGVIDVKLERLNIAALMELKRFDEAKDKALALVEYTKDEADYQQVASIYLIQGRYEIALKYLQSAYAINYNEKVLDKMAIILYVNLNRKQEAISYLETHMRLHGCSEITCMRLGSFYSEENNIDGMLRIYTRLYDNTKDKKYAQTVVKLYTYKKETIALIGFLEESGADDVLLLQLYTRTKNYPKVVSLSDKLYAQESDPYYLGQSAIFEYEGAKDKNSEKMINSVMHKLETVIESSDDPMYLNYLGYLLIDHDIDVKQGMAYVREALKVESESPFYLDSLAWGYYKQGQCKKALEIMKKVRVNLGKDDPEVSSHVKAIKKCIKKEGKKK